MRRMEWMSSQKAGYIHTFIHNCKKHTLKGNVCLFLNIFYDFEVAIYKQIRTHFARPNWRKVFTHLATVHPSSRIGKAINFQTCQKKTQAEAEIIILHVYLFIYLFCRSVLLWKSDVNEATQKALSRIQLEFVYSIPFPQGELLEAGDLHALFIINLLSEIGYAGLRFYFYIICYSKWINPKIWNWD